MADDRLEIAEALLAKARSTAFEAERESFVVGAYGQLGAFLGSAPGPRSAGDDPGRGPSASPSRGVLALPPAADDPEPPLYLDRAAVERAYAAHKQSGRRGVVVDLTI